MPKGFGGELALIEQCLRNKDAIEILDLWEQITNLNFNFSEFEEYKNLFATDWFYSSVKKV